jgi:hypothetical protein
MTTAQIAWWALVIWFAYVGLSSVLDVNKPQKPVTNLGPCAASCLEWRK